MSNHNQVNDNFNAGFRKAAAVVAAGVLALSGCASTNNTEATPTPTPIPAASATESSPESATPTPTPEQSFDPSAKTTEIKIGADVVGNYYDQLEKLDNVVPKYNVTLAGNGDDQGQLTLAPDGNSYTLSGTNNETGTEYDVTMIKGADGKISQILNVVLSDGANISVISNPSITDAYGNAKSWAHLIGKTTASEDDYNTNPYGIKNLVKQVSEYNAGGTNRIGETVAPSPDVLIPTGDYFSNVPLYSTNTKMPATILVTTKDGNTVGFKASLFEEAGSGATDEKVSNISPAEIQKLATKYGVKVSFKDASTYPTDDVALYSALKSSLDSLLAAK